MDAPQISVVAAFFNERAVLPRFCDELRGVMERMNIPYEVLLIDDGSSDGSSELLIETTEWPSCRIIRLSRNVGHQNALDAGLRSSRGQWVLTMDADLQHPPSCIPDMLELAHQSRSAVVTAVQGDRSGDSTFKRWTARAYYAIMKRATGVDIVPNAADFRLMSRPVVDTLNELPEQKIFRLLVPSLGFPTATFPFTASRRAAGNSKYSLRKMLVLATQSSLSFSSIPLHWAVVTGVVVSLAAFLWLIAVIVSFLLGYTISGWASVMSAVLLLGGLQLLALGLIGEYVASVFALAKGRPWFIVTDVARLDGERLPTDRPPSSS